MYKIGSARANPWGWHPTVYTTDAEGKVRIVAHFPPSDTAERDAQLLLDALNRAAFAAKGE